MHEPAPETELIAEVIGSSRAVAAELLDRFGDLAALGRAEPEELAVVRGVTPARAQRLLAALRLGRLVREARPDPRLPVTDAGAAHAWLGPGLADLDVEELHALYVDRRRRPLGVRRLTQGSDRFTVVDPRQIFRPAVGLGAAAVVLAHNHPSGDPTPSGQDREVTRRVAAAGRVLGVELLDHLVIAGPSFVSLRELGELGAVPESLAAAWTA